MSLIAFTNTAIAKNNMNVLDKCLKQMKIHLLSEDDSEALMIGLVESCYEFRNGEAVKRILDAFMVKDFYVEEEVEVFPKLFIKPGYSIDILTWLASVHDTYTHREILSDLIKDSEVPMIAKAIKRLDIIYGEKDYTFYASLRELAELQNNDLAVNAFEAKMREFPVYSDSPDWLIETDKTNEELMDSIDGIDETLRNSINADVSVEKARELITGGVEFLGMPDESDRVMKAYEALTGEEQEALIRPLIKKRVSEEFQNNVELFRILGPAHPFTNDSLDGFNECQKYGGHRMFLCNCYDRYDPETDTFDPDVDWFDDGTCDYCSNHIRSRYQAVRRPNISGGWYGAYCSMKCLRKDLSKNSLENQPDKMVTGLVKEMEQMLNELKIYKRE